MSQIAYLRISNLRSITIFIPRLALEKECQSLKNWISRMLSDYRKKFSIEWLRFMERMAIYPKTILSASSKYASVLQMMNSTNKQISSQSNLRSSYSIINNLLRKSSQIEQVVMTTYSLDKIISIMILTLTRMMTYQIMIEITLLTALSWAIIRENNLLRS